MFWLGGCGARIIAGSRTRSGFLLDLEIESFRDPDREWDDDLFLIRIGEYASPLLLTTGILIYYCD